MAFSLGELVVALVAGTEGFHKGIEAAEGKLSGFAKSAEGHTSAIGAAFSSLALEIGAAAGVGFVVFEAVNKAAESVAHLADQTRSLGLSAVQFQRLSAGAREFGATQDDVAQSVRLFNRNVADAVNGTGPAVKVFKSLGVSLTEGVGGPIRSTQDLVFAFADALKERVPSAAQRTAFVLETFGRGAGNLAPLFGLGSGALREFGDEAEKTGRILDNATVANAKVAAEEFGKLGQAIKTQALAGLLELAPAFLEFGAALLPRIGQAIAILVNVFKALQLSLLQIKLAVEEVTPGFAGLLVVLGDLLKLGVSGFKALALLLSGDLVGAARESQAALDKLAQDTQEPVLLGRVSKDADETRAAIARLAADSADPLTKLEKSFDALGDSFDKANQRIQSGQAAREAAAQVNPGGKVVLESSPEGENLLRKAEQERLARAAKLKGPLLEQALAIQHQVDELRRAQLGDADRLKANAEIADLLKEQGSLLRRQEGAVNALPAVVANVQDQIGELARLDPKAAAEFANAFGQQLAAAQTQGAEAQLEVATKGAQEVATKITEISPKIGDTVSGALSQAVQDGLQGGSAIQSFGAALQKVGQSSLATAFARAAETLGTELDKVFKSSVSGLGGILLGIFGSVLGAVFNKTQVESAAANVKSAVDNAQQVRGVIAGPTSVGIAQVGESIRDAFRESERLLGIIAVNTGVLAGRSGAVRTAVRSASGTDAAFALVNESPSLA
jgi:hypothetical protein